MGSDGRAIVPGPAESVFAKEVSADHIIDIWGTPWRKAPGSIYFEIAGFPLRTATIDDLEKYPWPKLTSPARFAGLAEQAQAIQKAGYATVLVAGVCRLRAGVSHARHRRRADGHGRRRRLLHRADDQAEEPRPSSTSRRCSRDVGPYVDVFVTGDDLGMTAGPMMSPAAYRRLIKPHHAELLGAIKRRISGKIFFHSCGNIYRLLGDLADVGVDLLNPVQVSAGEMGDTARLKREFGDRLSFCGGIDTRQVMPHGTPDEVPQGSPPADQRPRPRRRIRRRGRPLHSARRAAGEYRGHVR